MDLSTRAAGVCREDGLVTRKNLEIYSSDNMPSTLELPDLNWADRYRK